MISVTALDREEYVEQAYFFRIFRERISLNLAAQDVLERLHEEILSTTRLPMAIQFLATELKHTGMLSSGFARLPHYFTAFQTFVISQAEQEGLRFTMPAGLLILERLAGYQAEKPTAAGLFVYQFEAISRNRLGYDDGLKSMIADPFYSPDWQAYFDMVRRQIGAIDFGDLIYVRSALYVADQRRHDPAYEPPVLPLFGEKEGKIAKASLGRDPLFLFAALQRQLGYPEVPRPKERDDATSRIETMSAKMRELEARLKLVEAEMRGNVDLSQFKPEAFKDLPE
jgi:hypothetical protein